LGLDVPHSYRSFIAYRMLSAIRTQAATKRERDRFSIADNRQGHSLIGLVMGRPLFTNPVHLAVKPAIGKSGIPLGRDGIRRWQVYEKPTIRPSGEKRVFPLLIRAGPAFHGHNRSSISPFARYRQPRFYPLARNPGTFHCEQQPTYKSEVDE